MICCLLLVLVVLLVCLVLRVSELSTEVEIHRLFYDKLVLRAQ
jgi:hypothetical protein